MSFLSVCLSLFSFDSRTFAFAYIHNELTWISSGKSVCIHTQQTTCISSTRIHLIRIQARASKALRALVRVYQPPSESHVYNQQGPSESLVAVYGMLYSLSLSPVLLWRVLPTTITRIIFMHMKKERKKNPKTYRICGGGKKKTTRKTHGTLCVNIHFLMTFFLLELQLFTVNEDELYFFTFSFPYYGQEFIMNAYFCAQYNFCLNYLL